MPQNTISSWSFKRYHITIFSFDLPASPTEYKESLALLYWEMFLPIYNHWWKKLLSGSLSCARHVLTNHSFRCSLGNRTQNTANPAEANFSINWRKRAWETIYNPFPSNYAAGLGSQYPSCILVWMGNICYSHCTIAAEEKNHCTCTNRSCHWLLSSYILKHKWTDNSELLNLLEATHPAQVYVCNLTTNVTISAGWVHNSWHSQASPGDEVQKSRTFIFIVSSGQDIFPGQ